MRDKKLIIVGTSAFAEVAYEYFMHDSDYDVVAFAVEERFKMASTKLGLPVVSVEDCFKIYATEEHFFYVAITYKELNHLRERLFRKMKDFGYKSASYISSNAFIWTNVEIGEHCFIFEDNTIQPFAKIGDNVVLWSGNHIGHHSVVKDHCFISSHVVVSGYCEVGQYSFIGVNASVADRVKVSEKNFIGSGGVVLKNTDPNAVYQTEMTSKHKIPATRLFKVKK